MSKKIVVISLGGSLIIPNDINIKYLQSFKRILLKNENYKFIVVCGGGSLARKYINAIKKIGSDVDFQSYSGIAATRVNARFMSYFFGYDQKHWIPQTIDTLEKYLSKKRIIFCGALEYKSNQTSDSTAANIARYFQAEFINLTNVNGLYDRNPKKFQNAKFISEISWKDFDLIAKKLNFKPGQHFVLDSTASEIIKKNQIPTYILGNVKELDNLLKNKKYKGTIIQG